MHSIQPNETNEPAFLIQNTHDVKLALNNEQFSEMIPIILDFIEPQEDLKSAQKKSKKKKKRTIAQKASFKTRSIRSDFYESLTDNQLNEVLNYLYNNHQEDRLVNLFSSVNFEAQVKIIKDMLDMAFKANLVSYSKEVAGIRRKIAKGYVRPAKSMDEAEHAALSDDYMKAILYLNESTNKNDIDEKDADEIYNFLTTFKSNPDAINGMLREIMKWVPSGEYLTH